MIKAVINAPPTPSNNALVEITKSKDWRMMFSGRIEEILQIFSSENIMLMRIFVHRTTITTLTVVLATRRDDTISLGVSRIFKSVFALLSPLSLSSKRRILFKDKIATSLPLKIADR